MRISLKITALSICAAVLAGSFSGSVRALDIPDAQAHAAGENICGFTVTGTERSDAYSADVTVLRHDLTGASAVIISNDDPNRYFMLSFNTPVRDNRGCAHVFEHSAANGSVKYPSRSLTAALTGRGYATYANALTEDRCTVYPVASQSEEQLLGLAGYYADLCFEPLILEDEDIFRSEAWNLMPDADGGLAIGGTIYSEMKTEYTASLSALKKAAAMLHPDSSAAHVAGGIPSEILKLTYEDVVRYHESYYTPERCTAYLYGDIKRPEAFLKLLDRYFTECVSGDGSFDTSEIHDENVRDMAADDFLQDEGSGRTYAAKYSFPSYEAAGENGTQIVYAVDMGDPSDEELMRMYAFRNCCNSGTSLPVMMLKSEFPSASFEFGIEAEPDFTILTLSAHDMAEDDADAFIECAGKVFSYMAENGLPEKDLEAFRRRKLYDYLLAREGSSANLLANMALLDSAGRGIFYIRMQDMYRDMSWFDNDDIKDISEKMSVPERSAVSVVVPRRALAELNDRTLSEALAKIRASMSEDEYRKLSEKSERVAAKAADDPAECLDKIGTVDVKDLPEPDGYEVSDVTEDGVRRIGVYADAEGICSTRLYINASGLPQELLGYLSLYADLVNGHFVPAGGMNRAEIAGRLDALTFGSAEVSLVVSSEGSSYVPYVLIDLRCTPDDLPDALSIMYSRLFECSFEDVGKILEGAEAIRAAARNNMKSHPENAARYLSLADAENGAAYYEHTHYLEYYGFLTDLLIGKESAEDVSRSLSQVMGYLKNADGAVLGYAVAAEDEAGYLECAGDFLDRVGRAKRDKCSYSFRKYSYPLAVATGSKNASNFVSADAGALGYDNDDAGIDAALSMMRQKYYFPETRGRWGAYTCSYIDSYPGIYVYTSRDPMAAQTLEVFEGSADAWRKIRTSADDVDLNGYIISQHQKETLSEGPLSGAERTIGRIVSGGDAGISERIRELKKLTPAGLSEYDALFDALSERGRMVTFAPQALIEKDEKYYAEIISPFAN
ncbi:MAG: insulinase family protein [Lachnospiraceae bacterium]|nr:insulinase family protein [Lachnospiraceae bacterium]